VESTETEVIQAPERPAHLFTKANAAEMCRRGKQRKREREELARRNVEIAALDAEKYREVQLSRVRAHIEKLHGKLEQATEAKDFQFLATAISKLHDIESKLRGPAADASKQSSGKRSLAPVD
jgi:hypothetical protein